VRTRVDTIARAVTAAVPLVAKRRAVFREGLGCTLTPAEPLRIEATAADPAALDGPQSTLLWPDGDRVETRTTPGIDTDRLNAAIADAFAEPDPAMPRRTRAIVVVHGGRIVGERYADGYGPHNRFTGWSMTKSVSSALVGILTAQHTLDVDAAGLRPEWRGPNDPRGDITLHHLLTMSSGLGFDESYTPSGAATRMLFDSHDAAAVAAASPLAHEPGSTWSYSSGTTNIVSSLIRESFDSDGEYIAFARDSLFHPIGMRSAVLEPDPSGTIVGSSFMYATARDWARFGLLYLRDGVWKGERILPAGWVEYSVTPAPAAPQGQYGAHWWLNAGSAADSTQRTWPDLPRDIFRASGFEGQYVVVVPSHDLVVVRLGVTQDDRAWSLSAFLREVMESVANAGQA
jgi:CubicO group peptidase (beta-lactamase class C family)